MCEQVKKEFVDATDSHVGRFWSPRRVIRAICSLPANRHRTVSLAQMPMLICEGEKMPAHPETELLQIIQQPLRRSTPGHRQLNHPETRLEITKRTYCGHSLDVQGTCDGRRNRHRV